MQLAPLARTTDIVDKQPAPMQTMTTQDSEQPVRLRGGCFPVRYSRDILITITYAYAL